MDMVLPWTTQKQTGPVPLRPGVWVPVDHGIVASASGWATIRVSSRLSPCRVTGTTPDKVEVAINREPAGNLSNLATYETFPAGTNTTGWETHDLIPGRDNNFYVNYTWSGSVTAGVLYRAYIRVGAHVQASNTTRYTEGVILTPG